MKSIQSKNITQKNSDHSSFFQKGSTNFFSGRNDKQFFHVSSIQTKLTINQPNDPYEKEADSMADKVVQRLNDKSFSGSENNSNHFFNKHPSSVQRKCASCEKEEKLQKKSDSTPQTVSTNIESSLNSSKGSGSQLSENTLQQMESSFGADFSRVRIHNDSSSVQMNKDLHAQAFTHDNDIYFNSGKYNSNNKDGQHLLAHELTHVVQQSGGKNIQRQEEVISDTNNGTGTQARFLTNDSVTPGRRSNE